MFDIGIIGAGPAGYVAAIRAAQKGLTVVLFEKEHIGGTCLNKGCIPTKTILHSCSVYKELQNLSKLGLNAENISFDFETIQTRQKTVSEKIRKSLTGLIKGYGITIVEEEALIENKNIIKTTSSEYEVKNIIIATGSQPNKIKFTGSYSDDFVLTSDDVLNMQQLPSSIVIVGSGAIGIEWARIFSTLGVKVTVVEMMEKLLPPADIDISDRLVRLFKKSRIDFYTSTLIEKIEGNTVFFNNGQQTETEKVLLGAGRIPVLSFGKLSDKLKIEKYIDVDCNFKTNIDNIYAIGDVNGLSMLAHSASRQAEDVIEYILNGKKNTFSRNLVPSVIYGTPEIAFIGKTEQQLQAENIQYKKSFFPVSALGKSYADDKIEGFVKILADEKGKILGTHIISEEASAMIEQIAIAMTNNISADNLKEVIYAHPTYSEAILESILGLDNIAIHIPQKN
ncbi:dihydrolipoyl dehydrogenase [bacterium]|nr:dihydrolipoyl dehydrogenase [bacterium]